MLLLCSCHCLVSLLHTTHLIFVWIALFDLSCATKMLSLSLWIVENLYLEVMCAKLLMFTIESLLNQTFTRSGMSQTWMETSGPPFVPNSNVYSACLIFLTNLGLQNFNLLNNYPEGSDILVQEQWIPPHPMCVFLFNTLCWSIYCDCSSDWLIIIFTWACDRALSTAHLSWGIFSFFLQSVDLCPSLPLQ